MQQVTEEKSSAGRMFVPALTVTFFSIWIIQNLTSIFLLEVTATFFGPPNPVSIATTGQLVTIANVAAVVFGVPVGILSIRYNHKKLMLLGALGVTLGILGCFLAPNFIFMQVFYPIEEIGSTVINAIGLALVGELLVLSKRGKAIGWITAGAPMAGIAGSLMINLFFSGATESWRSYLLWFALPVSLVSLAALYFGVPSSPQKQQRTVGKEAYLSSFKQVFLKKSAAACLVGVMFTSTMLGAIYFITFFRDKFGLDLASAALIGLVMGVLSVLSNILGGYMVNKGGRKRLRVLTLVISTPTLIITPFMPNLWIALVVAFAGISISSMGSAAVVNLTLEQAPEYRGTMMAMMNIFMTLGIALGAAVGGATLVLLGWTGMFLTYAALGLMAAAIFAFLTKDPCIKMPDSLKTEPPKSS